MRRPDHNISQKTRGKRHPTYAVVVAQLAEVVCARFQPSLYCFSFELPFVIVFRNPRGKRETPTWQSHVPAGIFLRQLYRVSAFLLKTTSSLRNDNRGLFYPPVNLSNLTVSSRLGRPSPQMVSYHFLRQTRGHPDTTTAVRSTLACD